MWTEVALQAYYHATLGTRLHAARVRAANGTEPIQILFYHRVADEHSNGWTISRQKFARQIGWLRRRFDIVNLTEAQQRIASARNTTPTACITFDDGYAENCEFAIPLLLKHQIPFTYFISTNHLLHGKPFPHDVAAGRPLAVHTVAQLKEMAAAGVDIGAHTRGHVNLGGRLSLQTLRDEIAGSKRDLEDAIGYDVRYFAFPYGLYENLSMAAFRVAYEAGYDGVCSAYGGYNFPGDDAFHLRRFHADCEFIKFKNWLTVDPRKVRMQGDFNPGEYKVAGTASRKGAKAQRELLITSPHSS